jgi:hypothetical protein
LLHHADHLPIGTGVRSEVAAIEKNRSLLANPDPVPGMVESVTQALRDALNEARARCEATRNEGVSSLDASETWKRLNSDDRASLTKKYQLDQLPTIKVGSTEEVLDTLRATRLPEWDTLCDAMPTRFSQALAAAAKLIEPKAQHVKLPGGTIKDDFDLKSWLKSAEDQIRVKLKDGPVIL